MSSAVGPAPPRRPLALYLLLPAVLTLMQPVGSTQAVFADRTSNLGSLHVVSHKPPTITPGTVNLYLRVGDGCKDSPVATVTNISNWPMSLSAVGAGWLEHPASVAVTPPELGPGESATVSFTKSAVGGPTAIAGQILVSASPGGFTAVVGVTGTVENPAGAASPPYTLPPNCSSTPRTQAAGVLRTDAVSNLERMPVVSGPQDAALPVPSDGQDAALPGPRHYWAPPAAEPAPNSEEPTATSAPPPSGPAPELPTAPAPSLEAPAP